MNPELIEKVWCRYLKLNETEKRKVFPRLFGKFEGSKNNEEFFININQIIVDIENEK